MITAEQYRTILDTLEDIIIVCDIQSWNIKFVSKSAEKYLGYSTDELLNKKFTDIVLEDEDTLKYFIGSIPENSKLTGEKTYMKKDGSVLPVHTVITKTQFNDTECALVSARDISREFIIEEKYKNIYRELNMLYSFITELSNAHTENEVYALFTNYVRKLGIEHVHLYRFNEQGTQSMVLAGNKNIWKQDCTTQHLICCKAVKSGIAINISEEYGCPLIRTDDEVKSYMCIPVWVKSNYMTTTNAIFTLMSSEPHFFTDEIRRKINKLAESMSPVINKIKLLEENRELSIRDPLTGIYNRRFLDELLKKEFLKAIRNSTKLSIIMTDIDNFKSFNDIYGHSTGDEVLKHFTRIIQEHIRGSDTFARYGGEEFVIVLPETEKKQATIIAERIRYIVDRIPLCLENQIHHVTASFGVATFDDDAKTLNELLRVADERLYKAKKQGKNRVIAD